MHVIVQLLQTVHDTMGHGLFGVYLFCSMAYAIMYLTAGFAFADHKQGNADAKKNQR